MKATTYQTELRFKHGDRIEWPYVHKFGMAKVTRIKVGIFWAYRRHTIKHRGPDEAYVQFDGNKRLSSVPIHELRPSTQV